MNPLKCAFGITLEKFLGFVVRRHGIEIEQAKIDAIVHIKSHGKVSALQQIHEKGGALYMGRNMFRNLPRYQFIADESACASRTHTRKAAHIVYSGSGTISWGIAGTRKRGR
ncbi:hypothetical protein LIER_32493 [Lithospermum erythrorhizon]|uniref:Uncharacterized protein n=1 Tax=Lithospermum erythrorhizon TaxID=34254 RepID=A0AAV3RX45_LITER